MRKIFLFQLILMVFFLISCKKDDNEEDILNPVPFTLSGTFSGTITYKINNTYNGSATLNIVVNSHTGNYCNGTWSDSTGDSGTFSSTISGTTLISINIIRNCTGYTRTNTGSGSFNANGTSLSASVSGLLCDGSSLSGTFTVSK